MKKINIGLIGFGKVGSGVVKVLKEKRSLLKEKTAVELFFKKICDKDIASSRVVKVDKSILTSSPKEILSDPQIDIVIELIGGIHPAKEYILEALRKGKHIVTANKALLAQEGKELFECAKVQGKNIYFEASVGGGIPIIKALREGLVANHFSGIYGIINGTSNYILSKMTQENITFNAALIEAKKKGFAERNSSLDIEGIDSAHKLILLTYLAFGRFVSLDDVFIEGIARVSLMDVRYAEELGLVIKLLAIAKRVDDELEIRIHPTLISSEHLLARVSGVFNAIYVSSDLAGDLLFYGQGAGQLPATSSVISDLVDLTKDIKAGLFKPTLNIPVDNTIKRLRRFEEIKTRYYIRFMAIDRPGVLAKISGCLGRHNISIASVSQKERHRAKIVPIVMLTHEAIEKDMRLALGEIDRLNVIKEKPVAIRMEEV